MLWEGGLEIQTCILFRTIASYGVNPSSDEDTGRSLFLATKQCSIAEEHQKHFNRTLRDFSQRKELGTPVLDA